MTDLLYKDEVYAIVGAAMDVYNDLGPGFLENVYQEAMEIETMARKIPSKSLQEIHIKYKGKLLKKFYIADLVCYDKIIVELKAVEALEKVHFAIVRSYLKAAGLSDGLILNFSSMPLTVKRVRRERGFESTDLQL